MKKILSFALALTLMMCLCATAFAAGSPVARPGDTQKEDVLVVCLDGCGGVIGSLPAEAIKMVYIDQADELLSKEDAEAFKSAYAEAQKLEDCKVNKCYWLYVDPEIAGEAFPGVSGSYAIEIKFTCSGEDIRYLVNGAEMDVIMNNGDEHTAILTDTGAVTITCK